MAVVPDLQPYIGRFAPSPTGPLHLGSLYTALASFLQARSQQGLWRLRIDDLDTPRNRPGAVDSILTTLEAFGLHWDGAVAHQSQQLDYYQQALDQLAQKQRVYPCTCSRKDLAGPYPGTCRTKTCLPASPYALRIKTDAHTLCFEDALQGTVCQNLAEHGDFILKRKDQIIAYQFAVVLDDELQQVNHVLRGYDLLECTPRQIFLQQQLGLSAPHYLHVPIIVDGQGYKLSKQTLATAVDVRHASAVLFGLLGLLRQNPPQALQGAPVAELLSWAVAHWNPRLLEPCAAICQGGLPALTR